MEYGLSLNVFNFFVPCDTYGRYHVVTTRYNRAVTENGEPFWTGPLHYEITIAEPQE